MRITLSIGALSFKIHETIETIGCMYKSGSDVKRCLDRMTEITFLKPKPKMGDNEVTPSQDIVDTKIFTYQIR